jgi:hypothetical protein
MTYIKKFKVVSIDAYGTEEVVAICKTLQEAESMKFKCEEGDDKHDPCVYEIDEFLQENAL